MSEAANKAREAWAAMVVPETVFTRSGLEPGPMAPDIALDMVQDVTGDRDDAVTALITAGCDWLDEQTQPSETGEVGDACMCDARILVTYLRGEYLGYANTYRSHMLERCERATHPQATQNDLRAAMGWMRWVEKAQFVMSKCQLLATCAYPAK